MNLTIAIPTFNRNEILEKNLSNLLSQLSGGCKILVIDNCSDVPVHATLSEVVKNNTAIDLKIIRNEFNIGMTGNILKCFELCETPWLWILGDDDFVHAGAVNKILEDVKIHNDCNFLSYAWDAPSFSRKSSKKITEGLNELLDSVESIGVILFISTSVYNVKNVREFLSFGYFFQSSYAPHLAMLFMSLRNGGKCMLSREQIVTNNGFDTPAHLRWDQIFIYQLMILLRLPLSPVSQQKLKSRLGELTRLWTITHLIFTLDHQNAAGRRSEARLVLYKDIVQSFFYLDSRLSTALLKPFGHLVLRYPSLFRPALRYLYYCIKGKQFDPNGNLRI